MPNICLICPRYAQDMPKISPRYVQDMRNICPKYAKNMPKLCPRYVQDTNIVLLPEKNTPKSTKKGSLQYFQASLLQVLV